MHDTAILQPVFALAFWTSLVLLLIPAARIRSALRRETTADDYRYGESASVPTRVSIPNRNYMNLLEMPVLFYVVCLLLYVSTGASPLMLGLAWTYVALRVVHSLIHLGYNRVLHRLAAFAASNAVLGALWILAGMQVFSGAGH